jgi:ribonuclease E
MNAGEAPMAADAGGDDDGDDDGDDAEGVGETEAGGVPGQQQPAAFGENGDGRKRRRRRGRRGRRGRREDGGAPPYQSEPQGSPLGHLPTPAEALDAPDWPATGGFDTRVGAPPPRSFEAPRREPKAEAPAMTAPLPPDEPKQERSGIASFFFGPKVEESESGADSKPQRKGWWQKKTDA